MDKAILTEIKIKKPLVHCITNYVTANDCANAILAVNGSAIMADNINEVSEITTICDSLVINLGTLNERAVASMLKAGKIANNLHHPVILDPVGVGASSFRTNTAKLLLDNINFKVIRGNISEIKALVSNDVNTKGVDANAIDEITSNNLDDIVCFAKKLSQQTKAIIVITGAIDIITNSKQTYIVSNGTHQMSKITGAGCMLSAILGAFINVGKVDSLATVAYTVAFMGLCGELAQQRSNGAGSFKTCLLDALSNLDEIELKEGLKIAIY